MKKKNLKSLSLNKQTIASLNKEEMNEIKGGRTRRICGTSRGGTICISLISCACPPKTKVINN